MTGGNSVIVSAQREELERRVKSNWNSLGFSKYDTGYIYDERV